jgi:hypothetical protein
MSNQRKGNWKPAAMDNGMQAMKLRNFFRDCKELLEEDGNEDAAFYFEQIMEVLNEGKSLPADRRDVSRLLGL